jgi:GNAT superfamily N-acetyltransferase
MPGVVLRSAVFPDDDALGARFIYGLQVFERDIEPDRRVDDTVGSDFLTVLKTRIAERNGVAWIAEVDGVPAGWCVCLDEQDEVYVEAALRRHFTVQELFVDAAFRGRGVGQVLLAAAEAEARCRGRPRLAIGVLEHNDNAQRAYRAFGFAPHSRWMIKPLG